MMANPWRGEVEAILDGRRRTMRLTLGALAELEQEIGSGDLGSLAARFGEGQVRAADAIALVRAGLNGAGEQVSTDQVAAMTVEGGAAGLARLVADLLTAAFGGGDPA